MLQDVDVWLFGCPREVPVHMLSKANEKDACTVETEKPWKQRKRKRKRLCFGEQTNDANNRWPPLLSVRRLFQGVVAHPALILYVCSNGAHGRNTPTCSQLVAAFLLQVASLELAAV